MFNMTHPKNCTGESFEVIMISWRYSSWTRYFKMHNEDMSKTCKMCWSSYKLVLVGKVSCINEKRLSLIPGYKRWASCWLLKNSAITKNQYNVNPTKFSSFDSKTQDFFCFCFFSHLNIILSLFRHFFLLC